MRNMILCPICNQPIRFGSIICDSCKAQLDSECFDTFMVRCPICLYPKINEAYECERCSLQLNYKVFSVARYDGKLSYSVLDSFKFNGHKEMAAVIAFYIKRAIAVLDPLSEALIVPVPCSDTRYERFGWDQMVEVCKALKRPHLQLILNSDSKLKQQKLLNRAQRTESSTGKFVINEEYESELDKISGRRIIVIDDIVTTMSTMNSAISLLKSNGFNDVCGASWLCEL
ncbi:MAG: ComF family protein [Spirochaetales bacterium]|nr:ComF family protein [Spirochaetales bacterium]